MDNFVDELEYRIQIGQEGVIKIGLYELKKSYEAIKCVMGEECLVMVSENIAIVCFDKYSFIKIYVWNKKYLRAEDFSFMEKADVIGGRTKRISLFKMLFDDIKRLILPISVACLIICFFYLSSGGNADTLKNFNELLITVGSIFIATVFVFIGMFYSDKERSVLLYRKGRCDIEYYTDKYIISMSFFSLIMLIISFCICDIGEISFRGEFINHILYKFNYISEFSVALCITIIAVVALVVCFDSLINYYLRTCRNEFFVDAVDEEVENRKKGKCDSRKKGNF